MKPPKKENHFSGKLNLIRTLQLLLTLFALFLGNPPASAEISQTAATTYVQQWATLVAQGQADELGKLLNDSYQHIHGTGLLESKTAFLEALRSGNRKYEPIQLEGLKFRSFQDAAILTAQFNLKATARGKKVEGVYLASFTLIQTPQGLSIVSFQATPLKPAAP